MKETGGLKEFRKRLVKARAASAKSDYDWLRPSLRHAGFTPLEVAHFAEQVAEWYFSMFNGVKRAAIERKAMWDNSISAIDEQIKKAKS